MSSRPETHSASSAPTKSTGLAPAGFPYRMKDLCERTGLPRQAIHFYIQQGLLPQGQKTGRNMAYYGEEHVQRLLLVRRLQHERFLPLKAIRALLNEQEGAFTQAQRSFLSEVRSRLGGRLFPEDHKSLPIVKVADLLARTSVPRPDFDRLVEMGLLGMRQDEQGEDVIAGDDAWILETWAEVRALGFNPEHGFSVEDFSLYEEAIQGLFQRETVMLKERLASLDPDLAARMLERAVPILNAFLARYHTTLIRNFFTGL